jgi:hypothetical protein
VVIDFPVRNQSAIPGLGRKLMAESAIGYPDCMTKFVYSCEKQQDFFIGTQLKFSAAFERAT